jgi:hypothetical protein
MRQPMRHLALVALLAGGLMGCEIDRGYYPYDATIEPAPPVPGQLVPPQSVMPLEGQVVRIERDAYIIREPSGRETRVFYDRNTRLDSIALGDYVVVRYDGPPSSAYATSIARSTAFRPTALPPVVVGDRVIAYTRSPSTLHADFIAKR